VPLAIESEKAAKELLNKGTSYISEYNTYRISILRCLMDNDYKSTISILHETEQLFSKNLHLRQGMHLAEIESIKMNCYTHLNDYGNAIKAAKRCFDLIPKDNVNQIIIMEQYFQLAMYTRNYEDASGIFKKAVNHPKFSSAATPERTQRWTIFKAYLNYLAECHLVETNSSFKEDFDINTLFDQAKIYSKDKRGFNVAILILQILFFFENREFSRIIDQTEALKTYASRHLRNEEDLRSRTFIRMILQMEKNDFVLKGLPEAVGKHFKKLNESSARGGMSELEIVPYEHLWERICSNLD
jgi:tetratricopeptide (TPR) repeat protein